MNFTELPQVCAALLESMEEAGMHELAARYDEGRHQIVLRVRGGGARVDVPVVDKDIREKWCAPVVEILKTVYFDGASFPCSLESDPLGTRYTFGPKSKIRP